MPNITTNHAIPILIILGHQNYVYIMPTFPDTAPEPRGLPYGSPNLSDKIDLYDRICFSSWELRPSLPPSPKFNTPMAYGAFLHIFHH